MPVADLIRWAGLKHNLLRIWRPWPPRPLCHISYGWRGQGRPSFCGSRYRCSRPSYEIFRSISQVVNFFQINVWYNIILTPIDEVDRFAYRLKSGDICVTGFQRCIFLGIRQKFHCCLLLWQSDQRSWQIPNKVLSVPFITLFKFFCLIILLVKQTAVEFSLSRFKRLLFTDKDQTDTDLLLQEIIQSLCEHAYTYA